MRLTPGNSKDQEMVLVPDPHPLSTVGLRDGEFPGLGIEAKGEPVT